MDVDEQMHMIGLAAELQEPTSPAGQDLREGRFQVRQQFRGQGRTPVLGHENDMQLKVKNSVRA